MSRTDLFHCLLLLLVGFPGAALSQEPEPAAVQDARESLGRTKFPWYDPQADGPRPIRAQPPQDDTANRASNWQSTPITAPATSSLGIWARILQVLGILALIAIITLVVVLISRQFMASEVTETAGSRLVETSRDVDRVEHLPFHLRQPSGDFLSEARRLYEAKDYSQAVLYLYSHLLVQLDRHQVIRLAKGKTNRQYLRETRPRPVLHEILEITMENFEEVFFGHHLLSREQFEASWSRLAEFEAELTKVERAAA